MTPFKENLNKAAVKEIAKMVQAVWSDFDSKAFIKTASKPLPQLELKARAEHIAESLARYLPQDFPQAAKRIVHAVEEVQKQTTGKTVSFDWLGFPLTLFISQKGLEHPKESLQALKNITEFFSAEFAIRPFLIHHPKLTLREIKKWLSHPNEHIRRLASEGTRPLLPWGEQLQAFKAHPEQVLFILEALKADPSEYVRRSVANHLNDISKNHPDLVIKITKAWLKPPDINRERLLRHACRTLIKAGNKQCLQLFGYKKAKLQLTNLKISPAKIHIGEAIEISLTLESTAKAQQDIVLDYAVHHVKADGSTSAKVFKWKNLKLSAQETTTLTKKHSFKVITTRVYYPGKHRIEILVNGDSLKAKTFQVIN